MKKKREEELKAYLKSQGLTYEDLELMNRAFVHGSMVNKNSNTKSNERLEFLGDSVLSMCVSEYLFKKYPKADEGKLTRMRSYVVSEKMLSDLARRIDLDKMLILSWGEENSGGRGRDANLADAFESFLGAIFLDKGKKTVEKFLLKLIKKDIEKASKKDFIFDYKTELQYIVQKKYKKCPEYEVVKEEGPPHNKIFHTQLVFEGKVLAQGKGSSKKRAEQQAAACALKSIQNGELEV